MSWIEARSLIFLLYLEGLSSLKYPWLVKFTGYFLFTGVGEIGREMTTVCFNLWGVCWGFAFPLFIGNQIFVFLRNSSGSVRTVWQGLTAVVCWDSFVSYRGCGPEKAPSSAGRRHLCSGSAAKCRPKTRSPFFQEEAGIWADAS